MSLNPMSEVFHKITQNPITVTETLGQINHLHKLWVMHETDLEEFERMKKQFAHFEKNSMQYENGLRTNISYWNDMYLDRIDASLDLNSSLEDVKQRIQQIFIDSMLVSTYAPCNQSKQGIASGAYLARYGRTQFVMKLTSKEEFLSHLIVNFILSKLPNKRYLAGRWNVPGVAVIEHIDNNRQNLLTSDGASLPFECRIPDWIQSRSTTEIPQRDLMLMEMVSGATLSDFIATGRYDELSDNERSELFQTLGSLAAFDLVIGNSDRILCLYKLYYAREEREELDYDARLLDEQEHNLSFSNLGNLMLHFDGANFSFYLIDNVLDLDSNWSDFYEYSKETILTILKDQLKLAAGKYCNEEADQFIEGIYEYEQYIRDGFEELLQELVTSIPVLLKDEEWMSFEKWVLAQGSTLSPIFRNLRRFPNTSLGSGNF